MDQASKKTATEIFSMFLANNVHQGSRYGVADLLTIDREREFRYTFVGKHYLATVSRTELWKGPCVTIVVRCPLPEIERHEGSWVSEKFMEHGIGKYFFGAGFWYSACPEGMAFVLGPKGGGKLHCKISLIRSEPFVDIDFETAAGALRQITDFTADYGGFTASCNPHAIQLRRVCNHM